MIKLLNLAIIFTVFFSGVTACNDVSHHKGHEHNHDSAHETKEELPKGPHGGLLFKEQGFTLELKIFELGVEPHFRVYAFYNDKPVPPNDLEVTIKLTRLGEPEEIFKFTPTTDFLHSNQVVKEPHSFTINIDAAFQNKKYNFVHTTLEGRTTLSDETATLSGVKTDKVESREIATKLEVPGKIFPSEHKIAHIIPRFSGVVKEGRKHIGDSVQKGEVLAVVESNQSLQKFEVTSQISGTIIDGHVTLGEFVPEDQWIYIVADLSEVWADFMVPLGKINAVHKGQKIIINSLTSTINSEEEISYVAPYADETSQARLVRAFIENTSNQFLPGMFVSGEIILEKKNYPMVIKKSALQTFRDWEVVFIKVGQDYEARPVITEDSDDHWLSIKEGLKPDDIYVSENSYLIKADILKSGASHDH